MACMKRDNIRLCIVYHDFVVLDENGDIIEFKEGDKCFFEISCDFCNGGGGWPLVFSEAKGEWYDACFYIKDKINLVDEDDMVYATMLKEVDEEHRDLYDLLVQRYCKSQKEVVIKNNRTNEDFWEMAKEIHRTMVKYDLYMDASKLVKWLEEQW